MSLAGSAGSDKYFALENDLLPILVTATHKGYVALDFMRFNEIACKKENHHKNMAFEQLYW